MILATAGEMRVDEKQASILESKSPSELRGLPSLGGNKRIFVMPRSRIL